MAVQTAPAQSGAYKWLILALAAFTFTFVVAIPHMSMPVLFDEISADLNLSLVQIGWIWGIVMYVKAVSVATDLDVGRSIVAVIAPAVVILVVGVALAVLVVIWAVIVF